jgi:hypothetical protein
LLGGIEGFSAWIADIRGLLRSSSTGKGCAVELFCGSGRLRGVV